MYCIVRLAESLKSIATDLSEGRGMCRGSDPAQKNVPSPSIPEAQGPNGQAINYVFILFLNTSSFEEGMLEGRRQERDRHHTESTNPVAQAMSPSRI